MLTKTHWIQLNSRALRFTGRFYLKRKEKLEAVAAPIWGSDRTSLCSKNTNKFKRQRTGESICILFHKGLLSFTRKRAFKAERKMNIPERWGAETWTADTEKEMPSKHDKTCHSLIPRETQRFSCLIKTNEKKSVNW